MQPNTSADSFSPSAARGKEIAALLAAIFDNRIPAAHTNAAQPCCQWRSETEWSPSAEEMKGFVVTLGDEGASWQWWFSQSLANSIVDASLGGDGVPPRVRPLTEVDRRLVKRFVRLATELLAPELQRWGLAMTLASAEEPAAPEPQRACRFQVRCGSVEAEMAWLLADETAVRLAADDGPSAHLGIRLDQITVILGEIDLPSDELAALEVGDTIMLETDMNTPLTAIAGGEAFLVEPGSEEGRKAIRLHDSESSGKLE